MTATPDEVRAVCEAVAKVRGWTPSETWKQVGWWTTPDGKTEELPDFTTDEWTGRLLGEMSAWRPDKHPYHSLSIVPHRDGVVIMLGLGKTPVDEVIGPATLGIAVCRAYLASLEGTR